MTCHGSVVWLDVTGLLCLISLFGSLSALLASFPDFSKRCLFASHVVVLSVLLLLF